MAADNGVEGLEPSLLRFLSIVKHLIRSILPLLLVLATAGSSNAREDRITHLLRVLESPDASYKVKLLTMVYLGRFRARQAVPALVRLFDDTGSQSVRRLAITTLGNIGARSALPALEKVRLHNRYHLGSSARRAIQAITRASGQRGRKQVYLALGRFTNRSRRGGQALARQLRSALKRGLEQDPGIVTPEAGPRPTGDELARRQLRGYMVDGSITRIRSTESGGRRQLTCQIRLSLATYPGGSMKAFYHGEASVDAPARQPVAALYSDAIEGAARQARQQILQSYLFRETRPSL